DHIWITSDTVGTARQGASLRRVGAAAAQQSLRVGTRAGVALVHVGEIAQSSPVGVVDDVLNVIIGFLPSWSADDAHGRPALDGATTLMRQALCLRNALDTGLGCVHAI